MTYIDAFKANSEIINMLGEGNAHLIWVLGLYLEEPNLSSLASDGLTDGPDDKKIDFIYIDPESARIIFAQGYYSTAQKSDLAPANKAADLNTASAWLISGNISDVPEKLRSIFQDCRDALSKGEIETIELLYVHNLPESVNVARELQTAAAHLKTTLGDELAINISSREFGQGQIESLFTSQESHIEIKDDVPCPSKIQFQEKGEKWTASVMTVTGNWLHSLFVKYGEALFSANYRGFLGITKRRKKNTGIRLTAETAPNDFWVFNNGITLLTNKVKSNKEGILLAGISIINGAQTTGSIGSVDTERHDLKNVHVLCRAIECSDPNKIGDIVRFNNTQNEITTWDLYSRDTEQIRLESEFEKMGYKYARKRGFKMSGEQLGIEEVVQPLLAFYGRFQDANSGKNRIFERKALYNQAFSGKKARHVLFAYTMAKAINEKRIELKNKSTKGTIISLEEEQLRLLRNLRFKYFLVSVIANTLETIINRKIDKEKIAFSKDAATNKSIIELTALWYPIVESVIACLAGQYDSVIISERIMEEDALEKISKSTSALLYIQSKNTPSFQTFAELVWDC